MLNGRVTRLFAVGAGWLSTGKGRELSFFMPAKINATTAPELPIKGPIWAYKASMAGFDNLEAFDRLFIISATVWPLINYARKGPCP